jgi:hypothetical protein
MSDTSGSGPRLLGLRSGVALGLVLSVGGVLIQFARVVDNAHAAGMFVVAATLIAGFVLIFVRGYGRFGAGLVVAAGAVVIVFFAWFVWVVSHITF